MKNLFLCFALTVTAVLGYGQNTNVQSEVKTTVTTVKDSDGEKQIVKKEKTNEVQHIEMKQEKSDPLNKEMKDTPVQVTATTEVSVDGVTRVVDVDRSSYYNLNGQKYQVALDKSGYSIFGSTGKKAAILRKTSNNNYIFKNKNKTSVGYFDKDGNLVLETYDEKTDKITMEKYDLIKP
ncbi:hypothetical protein [Flavobacterium humi]|uniref:Uncharacterized protein n=1 Tax=Flavobacterium humi TaxID=2562683 RepID=A0A4Z0LC00_9FLAO|nr:hypothetical protein [Flavobacterium humi]TGD59404.1 hypothetical protein E4635_00260 [Flavobacterium humi]